MYVYSTKYYVQKVGELPATAVQVHASNFSVIVKPQIDFTLHDSITTTAFTSVTTHHLLCAEPWWAFVQLLGPQKRQTLA